MVGQLHVEVLLVDLIDESTGQGVHGLPPAKTDVCKGEIGLYLCAGQRHIKKSALFFKFIPRVHGHHARKERFFEPDNEDKWKFQSLGQVNGHQGYLFRIVFRTLILIGDQRHILEEGTEASVSSFFFLAFGEFMDRIEQFLHVLQPRFAFRAFVLLQLFEQA